VADNSPFFATCGGKAAFGVFPPRGGGGGAAWPGGHQYGRPAGPPARHHKVAKKTGTSDTLLTPGVNRVCWWWTSGNMPPMAAIATGGIILRIMPATTSRWCRLWRP